MTSVAPPTLQCLPCLDSPDMGKARQRDLTIERRRAVDLARTAVEAAERGRYRDAAGRLIDIAASVENARAAARSIPPDAGLPARTRPLRASTRVQVRNQTTLVAARELVDAGQRTVALNFANGVSPGGGFLSGARAQEEGLCRASALYMTLVGDPMYAHHGRRHRPDSTDWIIHSPDVPVFRTDDGAPLRSPWLLSFVTCAAPYAPEIGQPESGELLGQRIRRVLAVASALDYDALVLGAWGCGAFANDPHRTARDFRAALESDHAGHFAEIVFAITDWSPERRILGPFRDAFAPGDAQLPPG